MRVPRLCLALTLMASAALAGGPLAVNPDGTPTVWNLDTVILDASGPGLVPYRTDLGPVGVLENADAVALADRIFDIYEAVPTSRVAFENVGPTLTPTPTLSAGLYHMAIANALPAEVTFSITATITGGDPVSTETSDPTLVPLISGVPLTNETIGPGVGADFHYQLDRQFVIEVPPGAESLRIDLVGESANLDLFVRRDSPVAMGDAGALLFDLASQGASGLESIEIFVDQRPVDVALSQIGYHIGPTSTGQSAIIFDADGSIHSALFGVNGGVLGFFHNRPADEQGFFTEGYVVLNGEFIDGEGFDLPFPAFNGIFTHEFGHFIGLDHAQINGDIAGNFSGAFDPPGFTALETYDLYAPFTETLFPFVFRSTSTESRLAQQEIYYSSRFTNDLSLDEQSIMSTLYPEPGFITASGTPTGGFSGRVLMGDGITPVSGINVVARRIAGPLGESVYPPVLGTEPYPSWEILVDEDGNPAAPPAAAATDSLATALNVVSGAWGEGFAPPGFPTIGSGHFRVDGVPPGDYRLEIEAILNTAVGGSRIGPFNPQLGGFIEEVWSGASEGPHESYAFPVALGFDNPGFESDDLTAFTTELIEGEGLEPMRIEAGVLRDDMQIILETPSPSGDVTRLGALGTTAPITPPEGESQLLITNSDLFSGSIAQRFEPGPEAEAISFRMNFLTNEDPQDAIFNDQAILTVETTPGRLDARVIADTFSPLQPINASTGFARGTGWQTVTVGDLDLLPPGEAATILWTVVDGTDDGAVSGMLLDDIQLLDAEPTATTLSILPGLMSFGGWRDIFIPSYMPASTTGSDREHVSLSTGLGDTPVHGLWLSPDDTLPWQPNSVYRVRFLLRSDQPDPDRNPLVRLRLHTANAKAWLGQRLESTPASIVTPTPEGTVGEVWFEPPDLSADQSDESMDDILLVFEVLDFSPEEGGTITLERIDVDRFDRSELDEIAVLAGSLTGFDDGRAVIGPDLSAVGFASHRIALRSNRAVLDPPSQIPSGFLGVHREILSGEELPVPPGHLARVTFNVSSENDPETLARLRPRVIVGRDAQLSAELDIYSLAFGADPESWAPRRASEGGRDYPIYLRIPDLPESDSVLTWAVGLINVENGRGGDFTVNRVDIHTLDPTLLP